MMLNKKYIGLLLATIMILSIMYTTLSNVEANKQQSQNEINILLKKLDEKLPKLMKAAGVPGVQIALIDGDKIITKEYGYSDKANKTKVTKDTIFQVGSVSKMVTAWGVMKLVEEGKIDLDQPVEKYLTRWHLPESGYNNDGVTVRRLLSHTAGLPEKGYSGLKPSESLITIEESLSKTTNGTENARVVYEPGSRFQYSGAGYTLLQLLVEEVSNMTFEKYLEQEILKPLSMSNSSFEARNDILKKTSKTYGNLGQKLPNYIYTEKAAAGLYSTAEDLAKLGMEIINTNEKVLKSDTINTMLKKVEGTSYGLGYRIMDLSSTISAVGQGGTNRGWRAQFSMIPDKKQGIAILVNSDMGDMVIWEAMAYWTELQTGELPEYNKAMHGEVSRVLIVAVVLGLLFCLCLLMTIKNIVKGRRRLAYLSDKKLWVKLLRVVIPLSLTMAWWIGLYGPIINGGWNAAAFLPYSLKWASLSITMWCMLLVAIGLFPKRKKIEKGVSG